MFVETTRKIVDEPVVNPGPNRGPTLVLAVPQGQGQ
ncbi:hypothetical protein H4W29_004982 [Rhizobium viscosum]|uniref:Uncharacterized protein n=1 Tax=Rhizobium viscosum TaxID=1673 RepID=A0ABR9IWZ2_RHIVS|nr:hypothetical protein [Rhizobium viscosum]